MSAIKEFITQNGGIILTQKQVNNQCVKPYMIIVVDYDFNADSRTMMYVRKLFNKHEWDDTDPLVMSSEYMIECMTSDALINPLLPRCKDLKAEMEILLMTEPDSEPLDTEVMLYIIYILLTNY